jgi:hypothetical protein
MAYRMTRFMLEDGERYNGYTKGETWNGWECPCFELSEAKKLLEAFSCDFPAHYDEEKDTCIFRINDSGIDEYDYEAYTGFDIECNGETKHVYDIGSGSWTWDEDDGSPSVISILSEISNRDDLNPQSTVKGYDMIVDETVEFQIWDISNFFDNDDGTYYLFNMDGLGFRLKDLEIA